MARRIAVALFLLLSTVAAEPSACLADVDSCDGSLSLLQKDIALKQATIKSQGASADDFEQNLEQKLEQQLEQLLDAPKPVPPVSTTNKCIIILSIQFFAIFTARAILGTMAMLTGQTPGSSELEKIIAGAVETVNFAPMLAVLFLATRERALQLTHGSGDPQKYNLPQPYVQSSMYLSTLALLGGTLLNLASSITKSYAPGEMAGPALKLFVVLRNVVVAVLYVGFTVVCVGLIMMDRPKELEARGPLAVSDTAKCVLFLVVQYFAIQAGYMACKTYDDIMGGSLPATTILQQASTTVAYAPMLSILFVVARMRALQLDPDGAPQSWARTFFYIATYTVLVQAILAIVTPFVGVEWKQGTNEGEMIPVVKEGETTKWCVLTSARWAMMILLHVSMAVVVVSIFIIEAPKGKKTPPISTTGSCVTGLTFQYFFVYVALWAANTARELQAPIAERALPILIEAKETVNFVPMLCVLFMGARMRALQLTIDKGAPQGWVQDCMLFASWALLLELIMVLLTALATFVANSGLPGASAIADKAASAEVVGFKISITGIVTTVMQYLCLLMKFAGAVGVIIGIFNMTPENCNGQGNLLPFAPPKTVPAVGTAGGAGLAQTSDQAFLYFLRNAIQRYLPH